MPREQKRNLHVPLPDGLYRRLRAEAERTRRPATDLAREAIDRWLAEARRAAIHEEIASYAAGAAGTSDDLDAGLEAAGIEAMLVLEGGKRRKRAQGKRG
jgi:predicted transcriptional regulator